MTAPEASATRRWLRRFTLGRGPLRRGSDRVQVAGRVVLVLSVALAPPIAVVSATATAAHYERVAAAQQDERSRSSAVLLEDAPIMTQQAYDAGGAGVPTVRARATWSVPGGTSREGIVRVAPRTPAGTTVPIWVDREGDLTSAPLDRASIAGAEAAMAALPLFGIPLLAWLLYAMLCAALDVHRQRRWARDWAAVEPVWNARSV